MSKLDFQGSLVWTIKCAGAGCASYSSMVSVRKSRCLIHIKQPVACVGPCSRWTCLQPESIGIQLRNEKFEDVNHGLLAYWKKLCSVVRNAACKADRIAMSLLTCTGDRCMFLPKGVKNRIDVPPYPPPTCAPLFSSGV